MMRRFHRIALRMALCAAALLVQPAAADTGDPVIVELFTSQGCSSCPPADAMLDELADRDDVIPLALHVDYWDYIGWKDSFANPAHTDRQRAYARAVKSSTIYTPQFVVGGLDHVVGTKAMKLFENIMKHQALETGVTIELRRDGDAVAIDATADAAKAYDVHLVRYTPEETVAIKRGENAGQSLHYANIVRDWTTIDWNAGTPLNRRVEAPGSDPVVVFVQEPRNGLIVAAARLR